MKPAELSLLANAYGIVAAIETAQGVGIFDHLQVERASADTLIDALALEPRVALRLLNVLRILRVLEADGEGRLFVTEAAGVVQALSVWDGLGAQLTRKQAEPLLSQAENADRLYPKVVGAMADAQQDLAEQAALALGGLGRDVVDVGAGAATWSLALALRDPDCRITLVDRPAVLDVARDRVFGAGLSARFSFVPADISDHGYGHQRHDLALLGNVCHLFGEQENARLLERLYDALRPGGTLAVIESTPEDYESAIDEALHGLSLALRTRAGDVHPFAEYSSWMNHAGFVDVDRVRVGNGVQVSVIRGRRRG